MKTIHFLVRRNLYKPKSEEIYEFLLIKDLKELANQYLFEILTDARSYVPYYEKFQSSELKNFNILNKSRIKDQFVGLQTHKNHGFSKFINSSGGSTGVPQSFIQDSEYVVWTGATELYFYRELIRLDYPYIPKVHLWGDEKAIFGLKKGIKSRLLNLVTQTRYLNAFMMNEEKMHRYVDFLNNYKPELLRGYSGALYQIAKFIRKSNLKIHNPGAIVSAAETLRPFMRAEIEEVFNQKVYDFYGSREVGAIAGQCRCGNYHVFQFNNFIEVVNDKNKEVAAGQEGRILVTTLHNYSMPLIRYELGDEVIKGENKCACGSDLPMLNGVKGRVTDYLISQNGDLVHGEYFTHLFYFCDNIEEFQVVQNHRSTVHIYYVLVRGSDFLPHDFCNDVEKKIRLVMGDDCNILWEVVNKCDTTVSGKRLFTICRCV